MKKKAVSGIILTLLLISMLTLAFNIQPVEADPLEPPATEWSRTYGGAGRDEMHSVVQTGDGGYIVAGVTSSFGAGSYDFWLVKTDVNGNLQWNKTYGGSDIDWAYSVQPTTDGGYIVAGGTYSFGAGMQDFWLVKTDSSGNVQWNETYGGSDEDWALSIQQTSDGGYIAAGYTYSFGVGTDAWLVKTDSAGVLQWSKTYGGADGDGAWAVEQTIDGGYIIAGLTWSFGAGQNDFWLVKTDSVGNMVWSKAYGGADVDYATSVQQTSDGGYILVGGTCSFGDGNGDFWLVKTNSLGNMQWNKTYGGSGYDWAASVQQTRDGGYVMAGNTFSYGGGNRDFWLVKTDSNGGIQWHQAYGGANEDYAESVKQTTDGGYIVAGVTSSDSLLIKLACPKTWTVDDDGPADFHTIQEAINAANLGDTIYVKAGIYYENIVVNKTVSLVGENKNITIIDGRRTRGTPVNVTSNKVTLSGFTIQYGGGWWGLLLYHSSNSVITGNIITNNFNGVGLDSSSGNNITENVITNNYYFGILLGNSNYNNLRGNIISNNAHGAYFGVSGSNVLRNNHMQDNYYNFGVLGTRLSDFIQDIDVSNTVEGKPIYYLVNRHDERIPTDAGYVAAVSSTNISVRDLTLTKNDNGVLFANTNSSIIENVTVTSNYGGIELWKSDGITVSNNIATNNQWGILIQMSNNTSVNRNLISNNNQLGIGIGSGSARNIITENTISNNIGAGLSIWESEENTIYHNNFFNDHASATTGYTNTWDDGYPSGGNYWSDYKDRYPDVVDEYKGENQDVPGSDGIWDHLYEIDTDNIDYYPLMKPWTPLPRSIGELKTKVEELGFESQIDNQGIVKSLIAKLNVAQKLVDKGKVDEAKMVLENFIIQVQELSEIHITVEAADILIQSAEYILSHL